MKRRRALLLALAAAPAALSGCGASSEAKPTDKRVPAVQDNWKTLYAGDLKAATSLEPVRMTEEQWKQRLSEAEFAILRQDGTEKPFSSPLDAEKRAGVYACAGCALPLFTSAMKFDSGTGWPSFFTGIPEHLATQPERRLLVMRRIEYHCVRCGGHQGHVFDDGPAPTGQRWCNNGVALKFIPAKA